MITLEKWCQLHNRMDILDRWSDENDCSPSDLSFGSTKKVIWKCKEGHTWTATPNKITGKASSGCPYCANQKVWKGFNDLQTKMPEIAIEWHPTKNGSLLPDEVTVHSNKTIWWLCPEKHEYETTVAQRTRDNRRGGCPYCANKKVLRGFNDLETNLPRSCC